MTFERAWVLVFLLLPALFAVWQWKRGFGRIHVLLKTLAFAAIVLALAEPRIAVNASKVAATVLVDTSASISAEDLQSASRYISDVNGKRGRNWLRVMPFARSSRTLSPAEQQNGWRLQRASGDAATGTDLEGAIRDAIAAAPAGMVPRVVLVSDGNENQGSVTRAAWLARELHVPIDTVPLKGRPQPLLRVESISIPSYAFTGEKFSIDAVISSPRKSAGTVELSAEGKVIGTSPVALQPGANPVRVQASLNVSGAVEISGIVRTGDLGEARFRQAITLRRPRVLYVSNDPPGTEQNLLATLKAGQFDVQRSGEVPSGSLDPYQVLVLNNQDLENLPTSVKNRLEAFVKAGGGLLTIGGERNVYREGKKIEDALDRTLPAKLAPPRSPEGTTVVLIIDKSSSMEGRKMDLARQAAIGVIDNLRPVDYVGVLIFDNSFQWAVPLRRAEDRSTIKRLVAGITPDGGTQIAPALAEAFRRIQSSSATYRHIVLLTDGISEEGDSISVAKEAALRKVTISTVGLGQDVNRAYLEKVATFAKGRPYFLTDPSGLEQILLRDVMEHTGSTAVEKDLKIAVAKPSSLMEGISVDSAPPLKGYVKFIAKPGADTVLTVDQKDPLLTVWQLGLGRAAVFASDAKSRWAEQWIAWKGFDKFWVNVFRDLLPHSQAGETVLSYDSANGNLVVDYHLSSQVKEQPKLPEIFAFGPDGFQKPVPVRKIAQGSYRGQLPIGNRQGLFRVRPLEESRLFPETGLYRQEEELNQYGANEMLLKQVSSFTGGHFSPTPSQIFNASGRSVLANMQLWPGLLAFAILLDLIELILRKWRGIAAVLAGWRAAPVTGS